MNPAQLLGPWRWLAPALGCLLAASVLLTTREAGLAERSAARTNTLLATMVSNASHAAYFVASFHSKQNSVGGELIEWTNGSALARSLAPSSALLTNTLVR